MKKFILILMVLSYGTCFCACGASAEKAAETTDTSVSEVSTEQTQAPTQPVETIPVFEASNVMDNEFCKVTVTDLIQQNTQKAGYSGYEIKVDLENKSADKMAIFQLTHALVNGVECSTMFNTDIEPNTSERSTIGLYTTPLEYAGVGDYTDIELGLIVYHMAESGKVEVVRESVHVYPKGEDAASVFQREVQDGDLVLVDDDHLKVTVLGYGRGDYEATGPSYNAYLEIINKSDANLMLTTKCISITNSANQTMEWLYVQPHKILYAAVPLVDNDLTIKNSNDIVEAEFSLEVRNLQTYSIILNETFAVNP